ncbi:MAG TPA: helix-turn-helix transcriptional regulator [Candidatus Acidoferrales bacterium]|nr:helix-turn-helix transcriptional regulator [Candidatus Acidoferrales bacterium]
MRRRVGEDAVDAALALTEFAQASHLLAHAVLPPAAALRRAAAVFALCGLHRALALAVNPAFFGCERYTEIAAVLEELGSDLGSDDLLAAAGVLAWSGDAKGVYDLLREARDRALDETRSFLAVGALERLARHARAFGDFEVARGAVDEALSLAATRSLPAWRLRCIAAAAQIAVDQDDLDRSGELLDEAAAAAPAADALALLAPAGAAYALLTGDSASAARWSGTATLDAALASQDPAAAIAATAAALAFVGAVPPAGSRLALAVRRALACAESVSDTVEFLGLVARWGSFDQARYAVDVLHAILRPNRRYVEAHWLLARAHLRLREGNRSGTVDSAGDAARAFDAIGLRHWTNEAMLLLVRNDGVADAAPRRRPNAISLTRREQQVAHLIRRGASNREVARTLQISEHTVERHVSSILSRLGLRSRWQIVDTPLQNGAET